MLRNSTEPLNIVNFGTAGTSSFYLNQNNLEQVLRTLPPYDLLDSSGIFSVNFSVGTF